MFEVANISPGYIDSNMWFIQMGLLHDVLTYKLNKQDDNIETCVLLSQFWTSSLVHVLF